VCAYWEPQSQRFAWERTVPNTPAGLQQLLQATPAECAWVLEPTGRYSILAARTARQAGRTVLLAETRKAKAYLASLPTRSKTDRLDSRGLALFAASRSAVTPLPLYPLKSEAVEQLDQLLTARKGVVHALASLKQRLPELPYAAGPLQQAITDLEARCAELDQEIRTLTADATRFPSVRRLRQVPGIGPVVAAAAASRLTSRHFRRADQFIAYIGLDVRLHQSGQRKGNWGLSKAGDAYLRRLFYLAAVAHLRSKNSPYRALYEQQRAQGRSAIAAVNIIARKLARLCWSLVHYEQDYDPERVRRQKDAPKRPASVAGSTPSPPN